MTLSPTFEPFPWTFAKDLTDTPCTVKCNCGCTNHEANFGPEGGILLATDDANTRHIVLCEPGSSTNLAGCATTVCSSANTSQGCPGVFARSLKSANTLSLLGRTVCARKHCQGWWQFGLQDIDDGILCARCGSVDCLSMHTPKRAKWCRVTQSGELAPMRPLKRREIDAFLDNFKRNGYDAYASLWHLNPHKLRAKLASLA
jgi:hypothetical protein